MALINLSSIVNTQFLVLFLFGAIGQVSPTIQIFWPFSKMSLHPGWVAQLVGVSSPEPKGWGFDPQSGSVLMSWIQSHLGVCMGGN